jgi:peptidoglycan/xylan/chitin deacetylase (PgdA/CDA1 family)
VPSRRVLLRAAGLVVLTGFGVADPALRSRAATRNPAQADAEQPVYYIHDGPKRVALTIDDGPSPVYTPQILRLLQRYRITAARPTSGRPPAGQRLWSR